MTGMKDFRAAVDDVEETDDDGVGVEFTIAGKGLDDGRSYLAFVPTSTQIGVYAASFGEDNTEVEQLAATLDFLRHTMEPESFLHIKRRLQDRNDKQVTIGVISQVLEYLFEEITARPTPPSSSSSSPRRTAGARSTAASPGGASTRSRSPRAASATTSTRG